MPIKITTEDFIRNARAIHGDRYDYSRVVYKMASAKVEIVCPKHGAFYQTPNGHLRPTGCPTCGRARTVEARRETKAGFIEKARTAHRDRYDYSEVKYRTAHKKVVIVCRDHGKFYQAPDSHLRGSGCPTCGNTMRGNSNRKPVEVFLAEAYAIHRNQYDYSRVSYVGTDSAVIIICPEHGKFEQAPKKHINGGLCPSCSLIARADSRRKTKEQFIEDAKAIHGNRYDYSLVDYHNSGTKVDIICSKHGVFHQVPNSHLLGNGCPTCRYEMLAKKYSKSAEQFIANAREVHGDWFDYVEVEYINAFTPVKIICRRHGMFTQLPAVHLRGNGCLDCAHESFAEKYTWTTEQFITKAQETHGERYDYSVSNYKGNSEKVDVLCREHGIFSPLASNHIRGSGCPSCSTGGFDPGKPALVYYARINRFNEAPLYMIGITNRTFAERYIPMDHEWMTLLVEVPFRRGAEAKAREQEVIKQFAADHYNGSSPLRSKGGEVSREIFVRDVLGLDTPD